MSKDDAQSGKTAREERLAAKLRENLNRRKAQSRAKGPRALETDDNRSLPKVPPKS